MVDQLELSHFYDKYRADGKGGAAYDPAIMVGLLVYAYCIGERSSRLIEHRCVEYIAYRVLAANATPDHATIARFRADHEVALAGLFAQVLSLCAEAGMVRVGVVALDGTKIAAAAAKSVNHDARWMDEALKAEAGRIVAEAAALDEAEQGSADEELPAELARRTSRLRRLQEARARGRAARTSHGPAKTTDKTDRAMLTKQYPNGAL